MKGTLFLTLLFVGACQSATGPLAECVDHGDCSGDLEACVEGRCKAVDCLSSTSCDLYAYCDENTFTCAAGCQLDEDCSAGEQCDTTTHTCAAYGCRDTDLDCSIGEVCNTSTGECQRASGMHCDTCDYWTTWGICSSSAACVPFDEFADESYCLESCDPNRADACPRGYECADLSVSGPAAFYCYADCRILYENGWH